MSPQPTSVFRDETSVNRRIEELGLSRRSLQKVVNVALSAAADATPFHPANAAGTFAYQAGTWALRDEFVGKRWKMDRTDSVEAIIDLENRVKVVFTNVDVAANLQCPPAPRSKKGEGAERACQGNLYQFLPHFADTPKKGGTETFYLMVDQNGAAELSQPVIKNGKFTEFVERVFLSDGTDKWIDEIVDNETEIAEFDPVVVRKRKQEG